MATNTAEMIKKGEVVFLQGENPSEFYLLQSGSLEILTASEEFNGLDSDIILSKSMRVGIISGKTIIPGFSSGLVGPYKRSLRAVEDSSIVRYPLPSGGFRAIAAANSSQSITILRQLFNAFNISISSVTRYESLYQNVCRMNDNMALIYQMLSPGELGSELSDRAESLFSKYTASGGSSPSSFSARFLITDNSKFLRKVYDAPGDSGDSSQAMVSCDLVKSILKQDVAVLKAMIDSDADIALRMFDILQDSYARSLDRTVMLSEALDNEFSTLLGDNGSWIEFLLKKKGIDLWNSSGRLDSDFMKSFFSFVGKLNSHFEVLTGDKLPSKYPMLVQMRSYLSSGGSAVREESVVPEQKSEAEKKPLITPPGENLKRSIHQIFEFSLMDKEFQNRFFKLMNDFKTMKSPFGTDTDSRKIRRHISKMYWDIYKQVYIRSKIESSVPRSVKLMLMFGFLDEELLEEEQVAELNDLARQREKSDIYPVMHETEFLNQIYTGTETPSITEMGLTYEGHLREQAKHSRKKGSEVEVSAEENVKKTMYEIEQRLASTAAVCSGSTATAFPILNSMVLKGSLKSVYSSKEKVEGIIESLRNVDFSVFYRETVLKLGDAREIIQEEVFPYFILLPVFGTKTLLWQEMEGTNKRSRGRIVIPIFFMGDLDKSIAHTLACFRWELIRSIKGAMWADPVDGGLTGEYFDYVNNYKKISKLSAEAKEKVKERFKSLRTNRDRFADDYLMWLFYEKDGIMKLNAVVREMFFKNIPFRNDIRDRLENMPAFNQSANRYKNVNARKFQGYERRFKKYMDEAGNYPVEIQKFMDFLNL